MKSIQALLVGVLAMLCACQPSKQSNLYTVTGELDDSTHHGKKIYIMNYDGRKLIDSTFVEGNKFAFKGEIDTASFCRIDVTGRIFANLILESGDIKVNLKKNEYNQPSGTPMNDEMCRIAHEQDSVFAYVAQKRSEIYAQYADEKQADEAMQQVLAEVKARLATRCKALFEAHNNDALGLCLMSSVFMDELDTDAKLQLISTFGPWLKPRVAETTKQLEALKNTAEGMPFTDIKGKDAEGNPVALSDFVGKGNYVLLDMWASWCGPCKGEIPNLLKLHNQYKDRGLTVLGLFVWDEDENLKIAMKEEGIVWPQIIDTEKAAQNLYGVSGIPHIILFAPDGMILKRYLRGQHMMDAVHDVMKK